MIRSWHAATDCIWLFIPLFLDPARFKAQVLTGLPGSIFFFKSKRRCFSKKKQKPTGCNQVFDQVLSGHTGFFLPLFFLQPGPILAPDRPGPGLTCRAGSGFKTMVYSLHVGRFRKHEMRSEQLPLRCLILLQIFLVEFNNARTLHKIKQRPK
jgi:hypothetical protein